MWLMPYGKLPKIFKNTECLKYYNILKKKQCYLIFKRFFDILFALFLLILLFPICLVIALLVFFCDKGDIIFKQKRIKQYGQVFYIYKFRTMKKCKNNILITEIDDSRITKVGKILRKYRLDEIPQLYNIIKGDMSFVGARPEVVKYYKLYNNSMISTLLLPVGLTSRASIAFKNEGELLCGGNKEQVYIKYILPTKMNINIEYLKRISLLEDIKILFKTFSDIFN